MSTSKKRTHSSKFQVFCILESVITNLIRFNSMCLKQAAASLKLPKFYRFDTLPSSAQIDLMNSLGNRVLLTKPYFSYYTLVLHS